MCKRLLNSATGVDRLAILLLLETGLKIEDLIGLKVSDIDLGEGFLKFSGKNIALTPEVIKELRGYLKARPGQIYLLEGRCGKPITSKWRRCVLEKRLQKARGQVDMDKLIEKDKIIDIANSLFIYTDEMNWMEVKNTFADDVLFDMTSLSGGEPSLLTPQQIVDGWDAGLRKLKAVHHQVGNYRVNITEREADLFCYGVAFHYLPNPTNSNTRIFVGSYNLHFAKDGRGWKIDRFKFNLKFIDGNKDLEAYSHD